LTIGLRKTPTTTWMYL